MQLGGHFIRAALIILTNTDEEIATTLARKVATFFFKRPVNARQGHGREREDRRPGFVANCSHAGETVASVHTTEVAR
jgi:hypothetical protein